MRRLSFSGLLLVTAVIILAPLPAAGFNIAMDYWLGSSAAVGNDDTVLAVSTDGKIKAFDSQGNKKGEYDTGSEITTSAAVGDDGSVCFGTGNGNFYALNALFNQIVYKYEAGSKIVTDPVSDRDGNCYFATDDNKVHCVDSQGNQKWVSNGIHATSNPVVGADGKVYIYGSTSPISAGVYVINPDGSREPFGPASLSASASLSINFAGNLIVKTDGGYVTCIGPDGNVRWSYQAPAGSSSRASKPEVSPRAAEQAGSAVSSGPVIDVDGTIYFGNGNKFYALTPAGAKKWDYTAGGDIKSTAAIGADGTIYFGSDDGVLNMLDRNGAPVGLFFAGGAIQASPTLTPDGKLYFGAADGKLYGLETSSPGLAKSAWPMYMHDPRHTGRADRKVALPFLNLLLLGN
jgi:outer membrane protein assembly factor BamB